MVKSLSVSSLQARALNYVLTLPPSVGGSRGHDAAFRVACIVTNGFGLERDPALSVMRLWNERNASPPWSENELAHKIDSALSSPSTKPRGYLLRSADKAGEARPASQEWEGVASAPVAPVTERQPAFNRKALEVAASICRREITADWLAERSVVPVPTVKEQLADGRAAVRLFVNTLYRRSDQVLIFSRFYSQGDFMIPVGGESVRLGDKPSTKPVPSQIPTGGREGIWFLTAPVSGGWIKTAGADAKLGRRHEGCVTRWPYILLESDIAEESLWLRALVTLPLPVVALYTSGGKSIHALVKVDCESKAEFDSVRNVMRTVLCPLGADGAAMTAVRLSRLPGCLRHGKQEGPTYRRYDQPRLQRLVYLNPSPRPGAALLDQLK
jgi:hypothetical protein